MWVRVSRATAPTLTLLGKPFSGEKISQFFSPETGFLRISQLAVGHSHVPREPPKKKKLLLDIHR